ncbi:hypothetical protein [Streptomyces sp. NPDC090025]|uniref:hypothetical protein n=1 Tax=Streptomyces sp. NPDC090025 TaxID=3365922 RepID=UPI0038327C2E
MKQSAAKTLGVAALGAAFAAAAAGTATAAPALPAAGPELLSNVTKVVPLGEDLTELPANAGQALAGGETAVGAGADQAMKQLPGAVDQARNLPGEVQKQAGSIPLEGAQAGLKNTPLGAVGDLAGGTPVGGLLGGLPVGGGALPL